MTDDQATDGPTTEELLAEQPEIEAELLPAVAEADEIEPYDGATEVDT